MAQWKNYSGTDYRLVALVLIIVVVAFYFLTQPQPQTEQPSEQPTTQQPPAETVPPTGELVVAIKDTRQKLVGLGYATGLNISVKSIQVHTAGDNATDGNITAEGWTTIFNGTKNFDLIDFTDTRAIVGEKDLDPGKYTQIRLYLSEENSTIKIYNSDASVYNKTYPLKVPSNVLKLTHPFEIEENKTLVLTLDFDVPQIITREAGDYTLRPSIKTVVITEEILEKGQRPTNTKTI